MLSIAPSQCTVAHFYAKGDEAMKHSGGESGTIRQIDPKPCKTRDFATLQHAIFGWTTFEDTLGRTAPLGKRPQQRRKDRETTKPARAAIISCTRAKRTCFSHCPRLPPVRARICRERLQRLTAIALPAYAETPSTAQPQQVVPPHFTLRKKLPEIGPAHCQIADNWRLVDWWYSTQQTRLEFRSIP